MNFFAALRRAWSGFLLALAFLSRLAPARAANADEMRAAIAFFPFAGALLGLAQVLPFGLGLFSSFAAVQAWLYVLLSAWMTRALHLDGLADLMDALGSGKSGPDFFAVLKDSRLGAFGAAALVLYLLGQAVLAEALFSRSLLGPLLFAPMLGRCLPLALSRLTSPHPGATLGKLFSGLALSPLFLLGPLAALLLGLWLLGPPALALALLLSAAALLPLARLARKQCGYNGDFLGCAILAGETSVLLAAVAMA